MRRSQVVPGDSRFLVDVNKEGATCAPEALSCPQALGGWSALAARCPGAGNPGPDLSSRWGGELGALRLGSMIHRLLGVEALRNIAGCVGVYSFPRPLKSIVSFENVSNLKQTFRLKNISCVLKRP